MGKLSHHEFHKNNVKISKQAGTQHYWLHFANFYTNLELFPGDVSIFTTNKLYCEGNDQDTKFDGRHLQQQLRVEYAVLLESSLCEPKACITSERMAPVKCEGMFQWQCVNGKLEASCGKRLAGNLRIQRAGKNLGFIWSWSAPATHISLLLFGEPSLESKLTLFTGWFAQPKRTHKDMTLTCENEKQSCWGYVSWCMFPICNLCVRYQCIDEHCMGEI